MRSSIGLGLVGVLLATGFLLFLAIDLQELPLYLVCGAGVAMMLVAFWRDEVRGSDKQG